MPGNELTLAELMAERARLNGLLDDVKAKIKNARKGQGTYRERLCAEKLKNRAKKETVNREENEEILRKYGFL